MQPARIAELLEPFLGPASDQRLTTNDLDHISTYIDILRRWNARINLTAIRNEEEIVTRHFGESLFAARHLFPARTLEGSAAERRQNAAHGASRGSDSFGKQEAPEGRKPQPRVADLGSGAGFPGIPIKLWAPHISLTLIESNHKKATFLREVARALTLTDINIQTARAESLAGHNFDVVTLRAVERFTQILPAAASLVAPQGRLALLIGEAQVSQAHSLLTQPDHHQMTLSNPEPVPQSRSRVLVIARAR